MSEKTVTIDEIEKLYEYPLSELIEMAGEVTHKKHGNAVEFCSILSTRTGKCSQDCRYCSQSAHYETGVEYQPMLDVETVRETALSAKANGATRFCIVISGKSPDNDEFETILEMIQTVAAIDGLHCCCSLGILSEQQVIRIKEAGCERYNHNINTAASYHEQVVTTHTYADRINTIRLLQKHGLEVCAGAIIGMGESRRQRAEMICALAELQPKSVPVNILHPAKGTPFESMSDAIDEEEILKTIAIFRIAVPGALLRYAGGRTTRLSGAAQEKGIMAGINALLVGNHLTTTGSEPENDLRMIRTLGKELIRE